MAPLRLGCHLSISKGLAKAASVAAGLEANTFQFFSRNPRGGAARLIGAEELARWAEGRREYDLFPVVAHLPYTVNLAAPPGRLQDFARMVVSDDLRRVGELGGEFIVSHPGHYEGSREEGLERLAALLEPALAAGEGPVFCLEAMALQGKELGSLADLAWVVKRLDGNPRLGVWLDSAHLFAAGWDLRDEKGCDRLVAHLESSIGLERVKGLHLNDSKHDVGSRRDRHANIGRGYLGAAGISAIVKHPFLGGLPLILETPVKEYADYGPEVRLVKSLRC